MNRRDVSTAECQVADSYWDVDEVAAEDALLPVLLSAGTPSLIFELLGMKRPVTVTERGQKAEIPLWLFPSAARFAVAQPHRGYGPMVQAVLEANAPSVPLDKQQPYFYSVGIALSRVLETEAGVELAGVLADALCTRLPWLLTTALNSGSSQRMDVLEMRLFRLTQHIQALLNRWLHTDTSKLVLRQKRQRSAD